MASFYIRNSLNPSKVVLCGVTHRQVVPTNNEGEAIWVIEIATNETDVNGDPIASEFLNLTDLTHLDSEMSEAIERISARIDWSPLQADSNVPYVEEVFPPDYEVALDTSVELLLKERLPSAGIDDSSIVMTINGLDVTNELELIGDPYEYRIKWSPFMVVEEEY